MTSEEKLKRREAREERQRANLAALKATPRYSLYIVVLLVVITLVDILDNITTNTPGNIQADVINDFFVRQQGMEFNAGYSAYNASLIFTYVIGLITPFYKALGDKWGRKPLFVISTLGMAVGMMMLFFCKSYVGFLIGTGVTTFFLGHDIQILFILEEAPSKHRAKIYSLIKGLGGFGSMFIPLLRKTVMHDQTELWRNVYIIPAVGGILLAVLVLLVIKESKVFVEERSAYLAIPFEERIAKEQADKEAAKAKALAQKEAVKSGKSGIGAAIKLILKEKELRTLLIAKCIFDIAILAVQGYSSIMERFSYTTAEISDAMFWYPVFYCLSVWVSGFMADSIGRKKTVLIFGFISLLTFVGFIGFGANHMSTTLVGIMYGLYLGAYWIGRDYMEIMATEMVPTNIRASVIGAIGLLLYIGQGLGFALNTVLPLFMPLWLSTTIIMVPSVLISTFLLLFKVKETKGVDYEEI